MCNYIYCYSLNKFCPPEASSRNEETTPKAEESRKSTSTTASDTNATTTAPKVWSLFLHVPPAAPSGNLRKGPSEVVIPIRVQLEFVADLIHLIQEQLQ